MNIVTENSVRLPALDGADTEVVLAALIGNAKRIQRVQLSKGAVWIKRYGTERRNLWQLAQRALSEVIPVEFLRPALPGSAAEMAEQERWRNREFAEADFPTPEIIYSSKGAIVLADVGQTVDRRLREIKKIDPAAHDELLVFCARELGRLHASGLCHGRPHPRDMFFSGHRLGFLDFEEHPQAVMSLEVAQARDIWLLFLQIGMRAALGCETHDRAYRAWRNGAPDAVNEELRKITRFLGAFLSLARLIGRFHMGSDLQRFIIATSYLRTVFASDRLL